MPQTKTTHNGTQPPSHKPFPEIAELSFHLLPVLMSDVILMVNYDEENDVDAEEGFGLEGPPQIETDRAAYTRLMVRVRAEHSVLEKLYGKKIDIIHLRDAYQARQRWVWISDEHEAMRRAEEPEALLHKITESHDEEWCEINEEGFELEGPPQTKMDRAAYTRLM
eukprot:463759-Rhodomonas_salina.1